MYSNIEEMNIRRGKISFMKYLRATTVSDLVVVFGENSADVFGLIVALVAMLASYYTGDSRYDAAGSFCIGVKLICVAVFLSVEVKSLLISESASDAIL